MVYDNYPTVQTSYTPAANPTLAAFKDPSGLTGVLKLLLVAVIFLLFMNFYYAWNDHRYLESVFFGPEYQNGQFFMLNVPVDGFRALATLLYVLAYMTMGITFLVWVYRTCKNTHACGGVNLNYTPGWAVGWCLIPLVNLVMTCLVLQSIYKASRNPVNWKQVPFSVLITVCWVCWVAGALFGAPSLPHGNSAMLPAMLTFHKFHMVAMVIFMASQGMLFLVVTEVAEYQNALFHYFSENPDKHPSAVVACQAVETSGSPLASPRTETAAVPLCQNT